MESLGVEEAAAAGFAAARWDGVPGEDTGGHDAGPAMGLAFEAFLNPMELKMARRFVADLAPQDAQEEVHVWHLAAGHLLAAQRVGKSRQDGITPRAEQIEVGLAVRLMTLADRKSTALDRHRISKLKEEELASQLAAARAFREQEEARRAAEEAEAADRDAWRSRCRAERLEIGEDEDEEEEADFEVEQGQKAPVAPTAIGEPSDLSCERSGSRLTPEQEGSAPEGGGVAPFETPPGG